MFNINSGFIVVPEVDCVALADQGNYEDLAITHVVNAWFYIGDYGVTLDFCIEQLERKFYGESGRSNGSSITGNASARNFHLQFIGKLWRSRDFSFRLREQAKPEIIEDEIPMFMNALGIEGDYDDSYPF